MRADTINKYVPTYWKLKKSDLFRFQIYTYMCTHIWIYAIHLCSINVFNCRTILLHTIRACNSRLYWSNKDLSLISVIQIFNINVSHLFVKIHVFRQWRPFFDRFRFFFFVETTAMFASVLALVTSSVASVETVWESPVFSSAVLTAVFCPAVSSLSLSASLAPVTLSTSSSALLNSNDIIFSLRVST